ncbi:MAG: PIN domain-containing protein [Gracilibacteraceae bacterium]|nr:PIN domain-containing protein [Gracilibacteraceae bacterium]
MILLLDTNVVLDILTKRSGYEDSRAVLRHCETGCVEGFVSAVTVTDVMYILRKHIDQGTVRDSVQTLLSIVGVAGVLKGDIAAAFISGMKDFEDAVQASCAARTKADYIVTRNVKDFEHSPIPAVSPDDMLELLQTV